MGPGHRHLSERQVAVTLLPPLLVASGAPRSAAECSRCAARLDEAARLAREFHGHVLPRTLPCIHRRGAAVGASRAAARAGWRGALASWVKGQGTRRRWWLGAPVAAAALAAALSVWPRLPIGGAPRHELRTKGKHDDAAARLFVRRGAVTRRIEDGAAVYPGDALAFVVAPGRARFALVVSIDGARRVSVYSPYEGAASAPVPASVLPVALEASIILDDTLGAERIWLLLSDEPIAVHRLRPALDRLAAAGPAAVQAAGAADLLSTLPDVRRGAKPVEASGSGEPVLVISWLIHKVAP